MYTKTWIDATISENDELWIKIHQIFKAGMIFNVERRFA